MEGSLIRNYAPFQKTRLSYCVTDARTQGFKDQEVEEYHKKP